MIGRFVLEGVVYHDINSAHLFALNGVNHEVFPDYQLQLIIECYGLWLHLFSFGDLPSGKVASCIFIHQCLIPEPLAKLYLEFKLLNCSFSCLGIDLDYFLSLAVNLSWGSIFLSGNRQQYFKQCLTGQSTSQYPMNIMHCVIEISLILFWFLSFRYSIFLQLIQSI